MWTQCSCIGVHVWIFQRMRNGISVQLPFQRLLIPLTLRHPFLTHKSLPLELSVITIIIIVNNNRNTFFRCASILRTYPGQLVGCSSCHSHFPLSWHLWTVTEHTLPMGRDIFSESYDQQLSDFELWGWKHWWGSILFFIWHPPQLKSDKSNGWRV